MVIMEQQEIRGIFKMYADILGHMSEDMFVRAVDAIDIRRKTSAYIPAESKVIAKKLDPQVWELTYRLRNRICEGTFEKVLQQAWRNIKDGSLDWRDVITVEDAK